MKKRIILIFCLLISLPPCAQGAEELIMRGERRGVKAFLSYGYGDRGAGYDEYYFRLSVNNNRQRPVMFSSSQDRYYFKTIEGQIHMVGIDSERCPQFINPDDFGEIPLTDKGIITIHRQVEDIVFFVMQVDRGRLKIILKPMHGNMSSLALD